MTKFDAIAGFAFGNDLYAQRRECIEEKLFTKGKVADAKFSHGQTWGGSWNVSPFSIANAVMGAENDENGRQCAFSVQIVPV